MTQVLKNRVAITIYMSVIMVIMVLTGTIAFAGALAGPTAYMMLTTPKDKKLYPTLPEPKEKLTLEEKKERAFEDWLMSDIPDESSVWNEEKDAEWGLNRFHVELVKDKNWYAAQRVKFLHNEITKTELEEAFDLAREHVDVTMWQYKVEEERLTKERQEHEAKEEVERLKRDRERREREAKIDAARRKREAQEAKERREREAREAQERKERHAVLLQKALGKIPSRSESFSLEKSRALLEDKLTREKIELTRLRAKKKYMSGSSMTSSARLVAFYDAKVKDQMAVVKGIKTALTQLEVKATMNKNTAAKKYEDDIVYAAAELGVDLEDEEVVDAVWVSR